MLFNKIFIKKDVRQTKIAWDGKQKIKYWKKRNENEKQGKFKQKKVK